jgi:hypothetical protein
MMVSVAGKKGSMPFGLGPAESGYFDRAGGPVNCLPDLPLAH